MVVSIGAAGIGLFSFLLGCAVYLKYRGKAVLVLAIFLCSTSLLLCGAVLGVSLSYYGAMAVTVVPVLVNLVLLVSLIYIYHCVPPEG